MRFPILAVLISAAIGTGGAFAQTTTTGKPAAPDAKTSQQSGGQQSVTRPNSDKMDANSANTSAATSNVKLEKGANSFTEGETRSRLDKVGFKDAKDLKKDADEIWRGMAMQNGKSVKVGVDFKGNISAQ